MGGTWTTLLPLALAGAGLAATFRPAYLRERAPGLAPLQRLGIVVVSIPLLLLVLVGVASLPSLFEAAAFEPLPPDRLAEKALGHLALYLALPTIGLALVLGPREALGAAVRGLLSDRDGTRPVAKGMALSALLSAGLIALVGLLWALPPVGGGGPFSAGGASVFFSHVTPEVAVLLAGAAAVAEEVLFRGLLLSHLRRLVSSVAAIGTQAGLFGIIHAGYGSAEHVLAAALFGALMGAVTLRWGLLPAVITHFLVNVAVLALWSGTASLFLVVTVLVVGLLVAAWTLATLDSTGETSDRARAAS